MGSGRTRPRLAHAVWVNGKWGYLYRALDHEGNLLDVRLSETCNLVAAACAFFRSARMITKRSPIRITSDCHGSYPGAIRLEFGLAVTHCTTQYANNLLEQSHRAVRQRTRPMLGFKRFDSAARFRYVHDEVQNFLRLHSLGYRPASFRWRRQLRHHQFSLLREMMLAAQHPPPASSPTSLFPTRLSSNGTVLTSPTL